MNGRRMVQLEAPTKRMISVSSLRDAADIRIVVPVSMIAAITMMTAKPPVATVARLSMANTGSKICRWSTTSSTPSRFESTSETTR